MRSGARPEELAHDLAGTVNEIEGVERGAAGVHETRPLLDDNGDILGGLEHGLVAHVERAHELKDRNLERKVERRDNGDGTVRPAETGGDLTGVVAGDTKGAREKAHLIAREVFQEFARDNDLVHAPACRSWASRAE
jgi:hypothetical protein